MATTTKRIGSKPTTPTPGSGARAEETAPAEPTTIVDDPSDPANIAALRERYPALIAQIEADAVAAAAAEQTADAGAPAEAAASFEQLRAEFPGDHNAAFIVKQMEAKASLTAAMRARVREANSLIAARAAADAVGAGKVAAAGAKPVASGAAAGLTTVNEKDPEAVWTALAEVRNCPEFGGNKAKFLAYAKLQLRQGRSPLDCIRDNAA